MITTIDALRDRVEQLYDYGINKGYSTGWAEIDEHYTVKLGCTTYLVGHEFSGKSEWMLELLMNLSLKHGLRHAIFSPETGNAEEITSVLCEKYIGQQFYGEYKMSVSDMYKALDFINEHFFIIDPKTDDITIKNLYLKVDKFCKEIDKEIHTTLIDPFNELKIDYEGMPRDIWLEQALGFVRKNARNTGRHHFIVTHPRDSDRLYHSKDGYNLPPTRKDYAGGQAWARKGESMLTLWRPPYYEVNERNEYTDQKTGRPYEKNEAHLIIQKAKPRGIGKLGKVVLFYDWKRSHYFYRDQMERKVYADCHKKIVEEKPNLDFSNGVPF